MALKSLSEAVSLLIKKPLVWMPGLFASFAILFVYYMYTIFGYNAAFAIGIGLLVIFPAFLAGTYGIIVGDKATSGDFRKYAAYGYFRCLIPNLVIIMLGFLLSNTLTYILLKVGMSVDAALYFSIFLVIPLVFFFYFSDITAMVNNFPAFRALKDSAVKVTTGSFHITAFYLFNIALFFAASFIFTAIWSFLAVDALLPISQMNQGEILALSQTELLALFTAPEILSSGCIALALCAFIFVPLVVSYKACFFKRNLLKLEAEQKKEEQPGSFDADGRWYKYS